MREEWLSHLTYGNPVGVNRILQKYGFSGYLQPDNRDDTIEALEMLIEQNGTDGIRDLLMIMPEFDAIREILTPKANIIYSAPVIRNATGSEKPAGDILGIPVDHILKGALIFSVIYLLTKKM